MAKTETLNPIKPKSKRGGKRPGAGRKPGSRNIATTEEIRDIAAAARKFAPEAIATLAAVMKKGESEAARVSAATQILDRAYGKPSQHTELTGKDGAAVLVQQEVTLEEQSSYELARRIAYALSQGKKRTKATA